MFTIKLLMFGILGVIMFGFALFKLFRLCNKGISGYKTEEDVEHFWFDVISVIGLLFGTILSIKILYDSLTY